MKDFLLDFFKELNSSANRHTIALAVVLGLISGFLPTFTFLNYLIWFFVLILRVPLGLYMASFSLFSLISYFFDPVFNRIGYILLTDEGLKPLWTTLYNTPFLRWSGFNNTLVMGSFISGIIVGAFFYALLVKSVSKYREFVFPKIKKIKYLSWIVPKEEKKSVFRISGFIAIGVVMGVFLLLFTLLTPLLEKVLSFTLTKTLHQKVVVEDLKIKPFSVQMRVLGEHFEAERVFIDFDAYYLMWKKFKIISEVKVKTEKNMVELIKKLSSKKAKSRKELSLDIKIDYSKIFKTHKFYSLEAVKKLQTDYQEFKKELKEFNLTAYKNRIKEIESEIEGLDVKIKTAGDIKGLIKKVDKIKSQIDTLLKELKVQKEKITKEEEILKEDLKNVKEALKKDYAFIDKEFDNLKEGRYIEFSKAFLAPKIVYYIQTAENLYQKIKPYLPKQKEHKPQIKRSGVYIKFEERIKYPDFVLAEFLGDVKNSLGEYKIKAYNLADNQILLGKYAKIYLLGDTDFWKLKGEVKYFKGADFNFSAKDVKIKKIEFDKIVLVDNRLELNLSGVYDKKIKALLSCVIKPSKIEIRFKKYRDCFARLLKNVKFITFEAKIEDKRVLRVNSNLDNLLAKGFRDIYRDEISKERLRAKQVLSKRVNEALRGVDLSEFNISAADLNSIESLLKGLRKKADAIVKEKRKKIENRLKNELKNRIKDKLKIF